MITHIRENTTVTLENRRFTATVTAPDNSEYATSWPEGHAEAREAAIRALIEKMTRGAEVNILFCLAKFD